MNVRSADLPGGLRGEPTPALSSAPPTDATNTATAKPTLIASSWEIRWYSSARRRLRSCAQPSQSEGTTGSSASASAAVAKRLGLVDSSVTVHMQGGTLDIAVDDSFNVLMTGAVTRVAEGEFFEEMFLWKPRG